MLNIAHGLFLTSFEVLRVSKSLKVFEGFHANAETLSITCLCDGKKRFSQFLSRLRLIFAASTDNVRGDVHCLHGCISFATHEIKFYVGSVRHVSERQGSLSNVRFLLR